MRILIISSTVRENRKTHQVAEAIASSLDQNFNIDTELIDLAEYDLNNLKHLFKSDPSPTEDKKKVYKLFKNCDGYIFVSPEYNGSYCGSLKNAVDHFPKTCYERKPIGISTVSSGAMGGMRAALQLQLLVLALKAYPMPEMLLTPNVGDKFEDGELLDSDFQKKITYFLEEYVWFAKKIVL